MVVLWSGVGIVYSVYSTGGVADESAIVCSRNWLLNQYLTVE